MCPIFYNFPVPGENCEVKDVQSKQVYIFCLHIWFTYFVSLMCTVADLTKYEISSDEDDLPFKCFICRDSFKNPVITK